MLEGNRGKRALVEEEPRAELLSDLEPPAWLQEDARDIWRDVAIKLRRALVLTELDTYALEMACVAIATWRRAARAAAEAPQNGAMIDQRAVAASMAYKQAMTALREFGLTPVARTRIIVERQESLFAGGGDEGVEQYFTRQ